MTCRPALKTRFRNASTGWRPPRNSWRSSFWNDRKPSGSWPGKRMNWCARRTFSSSTSKIDRSRSRRCRSVTSQCSTLLAKASTDWICRDAFASSIRRPPPSRAGPWRNLRDAPNARSSATIRRGLRLKQPIRTTRGMTVRFSTGAMVPPIPSSTRASRSRREIVRSARWWSSRISRNENAPRKP